MRFQVIGYEHINQKSRSLAIQDPSSMPLSDPEKCWFVVSQEKSGDEYHFPLFSSSMLSLLSLPHSSDIVEQIFSILHTIKTKHRTNLKASALNRLVRSKYFLKHADCTISEPNERFWKNLFKQNWYSKEFKQDHDANF